MMKFNIQEVQKEMVDNYVNHFKTILDKFFKEHITLESELKAIKINKDEVKYVLLVDKPQLRLNYQHLTDRLPTFESKIIVSSNNSFLINPDKLSHTNLIDELNNLSFFYGDKLMYKDYLDYQFSLDNKYETLVKWA